MALLRGVRLSVRQQEASVRQAHTSAHSPDQDHLLLQLAILVEFRADLPVKAASAPRAVSRSGQGKRPFLTVKRTEGAS